MLGQYPFQAHTFIERDPVAFKSIQYITYTRQRRHFAVAAVQVSALYRFQWAWSRGSWTFGQYYFVKVEVYQAKSLQIKVGRFKVIHQDSVDLDVKTGREKSREVRIYRNLTRQIECFCFFVFFEPFELISCIVWKEEASVHRIEVVLLVRGATMAACHCPVARRWLRS